MAAVTFFGFVFMLYKLWFYTSQYVIMTSYVFQILRVISGGLVPERQCIRIEINEYHL